ncbi:MAG: helix-turn-helix transcriptional regulator [Desulfobacterales bacterium]|nr:helix-turn-helix transcriptional regulator [Desulfobacterales bacterium]
MKSKDSSIPLDFPQKLKAVRNESGLTQGQLAELIGVDIQRVSKYERGVMVPTTDIIVKIADILKVNLDYLLRDGTNKTIGKVKDSQLLDYIGEIDNLPDKDRDTLKILLEAFIKKHHFEELAKRKTIINN